MNILVADDDRLSREMIRRIIENDDAHEVTLAGDGEEAWKILCDSPKPFDLGIFDIHMPRIDGFRLLERVRATPGIKDLKAILCTAAADRTTVEKAGLLSVSHYIVKPYTKSVILEKLKEVQRELVQNGAEDRESVLLRLGMDEDTYLTLLNTLLEEVAKWIQMTRYTSDLQRFVRLAQRATGLRGACLTFGLTTLAAKFEEVEFTLTRDSAASEGQQSPLLFAQIAPVFESLDREVNERMRHLSNELGSTV